MAYNASYQHLNNTATLYALPESEDVGSTTGLIAGTYNAAAEKPNTYDFIGLDDGVNYYVHVQVGASPSVNDIPEEGVILATVNVVPSPIIVIAPAETGPDDCPMIPIVQGDDYTETRKLVIELVTDDDLVDEFMIVAVTRPGKPGSAFRCVVYAADDRQFFAIEMASTITAAFATGDWRYLIRREDAVSKESQIASGIWRVSGFVTPSPIQGVPR